jgi:hypothetical protein
MEFLQMRFPIGFRARRTRFFALPLRVCGGTAHRIRNRTDERREAAFLTH